MLISLRWHLVKATDICFILIYIQVIPLLSSDKIH